jgi:hypothetical protein
MSKHKRKHPELNKNCFNCNNCEYIGEGDYICSMNNDIVIGEWQPTEDFNSCGGAVYHQKITHWMPLPEAPKMKGGAE